MKAIVPQRLFHRAFEIGVLLKGLDGLLELIGGLLLFIIHPAQINVWLRFLTQYELSEDPHDRIANYLVQAAHHLSFRTEVFGAVYLVSHAIVKILIVWGLLKNKLWAYPFGIAVFSAFGLYQLYRYTFAHALSLIILTVLDVLIIGLTWHEYGYVKSQRPV